MNLIKKWQKEYKFKIAEANNIAIPKNERVKANTEAFCILGFLVDLNELEKANALKTSTERERLIALLEWGTKENMAQEDLTNTEIVDLYLGNLTSNCG